MIAFGPDVCRDFSQAIGKEWLETNGLGGYASSTIIGMNTRRYHALLIVALHPPSRRMVLLSKLEETLAVRELEYDLSCNQYPGAIHPQGYQYLSGFRLDPFPTFVYEVLTPAGACPERSRRSAPSPDLERGTDDEKIPNLLGYAPSLNLERGMGGEEIRLEKSVLMCHGYNMVIVRYRLLSSAGTVSLIVRPLVNYRDHHHLMRENAYFDTTAEISGARDRVLMKPYQNGPPLSLRLKGAYFEMWGDWYRNFEYAEEARRGLDFQEDLYSPGFFTYDLDQGEDCYLVASIEEIDDRLDLTRLVESERERRASLVKGWETASGDLKTLVQASDSYIVRRAEPLNMDDSYGIIAGYHWFEEWGRDALISLPGLTLVTGRYDITRSVLTTFARYCKEGLLPNRIPNVGEEPDYNSVDAALWMFWAAHKYLDYTQDRDFVADYLLPTLQEIITWYARGTHYEIKADEDGLLSAGTPGTQLTWMDAKVGDWVVTPRHGKAVEINALWHHALKFMEELGEAHVGPSSEQMAASFRARFWNQRLGYLNDVVDGEVREDESLRPNQIFAVSLPYPILPIEQARQVVEVVKRELLTPYGLRTLSPRDPRYRGIYTGDQYSRDSAYHQGTVWPWLLGHFISAYIKTTEDKPAAIAEGREWLKPLLHHLRDAGLGQISEIFDSNPPHHPRGCIAQAWSMAEILRCTIEDLGWLRQ